MSVPASPLDLYEPLDVIGTGSFGIIRKVRRKIDGAVLACKELNFERMTDRDRKQIVAEVNILKDLHHDNIVRYYDRYVDREKGVLFILMEYCGGGDLGSVIKGCQRSGRQIPEENVWSYMLQILLALQYCHSPDSRSENQHGDVNPEKRQQILHRDIKPENVFLDSDHGVKLGDFGLSKALGPASTFASTYVGTPYYMSPELIQEKAYDTKSDIWSLGCLIYELCALKPPFHEAQTHQELATFIRNGRIPPLPRGYSNTLTSVIKSMLNINPALRPSSQQLLNIERISQEHRNYDLTRQVLAFKAQRLKTLQDLQEREAILASKEKELQSILQAREDEIRVMLERKDAEIAEQESQMRTAFVEWEREVQLNQQKQEQNFRQQEESLRNEVIQWQANVKTQWDLREGEWTRELQRLQETCKRQEEENQQLRAQNETLKAEKADASRKLPLGEVQNTLSSKMSNIKLSDMTKDSETPVRANNDAAARRQRGRMRTPNPFSSGKTHTKALSEPQSAMKGVILTETGEAISTPIPSSNTLMNLLSNSPVRGFKGFGRLTDEYQESPEFSEVLEPPSPEDEEETIHKAIEPSPSVVAAASRQHRRTSSAKIQRPNFSSVSTEPLPSPAESSDESLINDLDIAHSAPASTYGHGISSASSSAASLTSEPEFDEDRFTSPYLKRVERGSKGGFRPQPSGSRRASTETSKALRTAAAANAAKPNATAALVSRVGPPGRVTPSAGRMSKSPDEMRRLVNK